MVTPASTFHAGTDGGFTYNEQQSCETESLSKKAAQKELKRETRIIDGLQQRLYAENRRAVLCVFQAIDAAGKDSTIRNVFGRLNPAGCQVFSFKAPSKEELDHDFLWRTASRLPERGRIGVFNRSYYEEVLVVKVHPQYLAGQGLSTTPDQAFWDQRYESIRSHEAHLAANGTVVLKFWLNVSKEEQAARFLSRLEEPEKHWKFSAGDLKERARWDDYMSAYQECIRATSTEQAPWYVIPANNKPQMRLHVARILRQTLEAMNPSFPEVGAADQNDFDIYIDQLKEAN